MLNLKEQYELLITTARLDSNNRKKDKGLYAIHHVYPTCLRLDKGLAQDNRPENLVKLTHAEHYEAHRLLHLLHPERIGLATAFFLMSHRNGVTVDAEAYASARQEISKRAYAMQSEEHVCPHCNKLGKGTVFKRWHFDNCLENLNNVGLTHKQIVYRNKYGFVCDLEKPKKPRNCSLTSGALLDELTITYRLVWLLDSDLTVFGWVTKAAKAWGLSHTQVRRFVSKYYWLPFYQR
jgi:hypothetical protein